MPADGIAPTLIAKFIGANMGPTWGQQDPGGSHVGPMNLAIWLWCWDIDRHTDGQFESCMCVGLTLEYGLVMPYDDIHLGQDWLM